MQTSNMVLSIDSIARASSHSNLLQPFIHAAAAVLSHTCYTSSHRAKQAVNLQLEPMNICASAYSLRVNGVKEPAGILLSAGRLAVLLL